MKGIGKRTKRSGRAASEKGSRRMRGPCRKRRKIYTSRKRELHDHGESSTVLCPICYDHKSRDEIFDIEGCNHSFCKECISNHIGAKVQENIAKVKCPSEDCNFGIEPQNCKDIVPTELLERWESALCESAIIASQKFYCPFGDCSALMMKDGEEKMTACECPVCHRLFCAQCKVPWHGGLGCKAYQRLEDNNKTTEDVKLFNLSKESNWCRCNKCGHVVEKVDGCIHTTCRCGHEFCYKCGTKWQHNHLCSREPTTEKIFPFLSAARMERQATLLRIYSPARRDAPPTTRRVEYKPRRMPRMRGTLRTQNASPTTRLS